IVEASAFESAPQIQKQIGHHPAGHIAAAAGPMSPPRFGAIALRQKPREMELTFRHRPTPVCPSHAGEGAKMAPPKSTSDGKASPRRSGDRVPCLMDYNLIAKREQSMPRMGYRGRGASPSTRLAI